MQVGGMAPRAAHNREKRVQFPHLLLVSLACATSCAAVGMRGAVVERPGLAEATAFVWQAYGRRDTAPKVRVVEGAELSCTDPNSGKPGFVVILGAEDGSPRQDCREGFTMSPLEVSVAWHGEPWSRTSLAHEMMHARQARDGIIDPDHRRIEWGPGGEVDQANAALEAQGR